MKMVRVYQMPMYQIMFTLQVRKGAEFLCVYGDNDNYFAAFIEDVVECELESRVYYPVVDCANIPEPQPNCYMKFIAPTLNRDGVVEFLFEEIEDSKPICIELR